MHNTNQISFTLVQKKLGWRWCDRHWRWHRAGWLDAGVYEVCGLLWKPTAVRLLFWNVRKFHHPEFVFLEICLLHNSWHNLWMFPQQKETQRNPKFFFTICIFFCFTECFKYFLSHSLMLKYFYSRTLYFVFHFLKG